MWVLYAITGAVFAALTSIFAKIGIKNVDSNLATAIRTVAVIIVAWGIVFLTGKTKEIPDITQKGWIFLILSGVSTGLSWLFFYRALQLGDVSKVITLDKLSIVITIVLSFIILKEAVSAKIIAGIILITAGTLLMCL